MADSKKYDGSQWEHSLRKLTTATEAVENPLYSDGTAITAYNIKGNEEHTGTPTPSNPVEVNGVGVRTKNLLKNDAVSTEFRGIQYTVNADKSVTLYGTAGSQVSFFILMGDGAATNDLSAYTTPIFKAGDSLIFSTGTSINLQARYTDGTYYNDIPNNQVITLAKDVGLIYLQVASSSINTTAYPMVTLSTETDTTYEPYGYKIPISSGGVTTNIYLGSTQTVRQVKKIMFDGTENWMQSSSYTFYIRSVNDYLHIKDIICVSSHYVAQINVDDGDPIDYGTCCFYCGVDEHGEDIYVLYLKNITAYSTVADFKAFLAAQYSAGTPVTVWYVLATPQTATVNEPLMKIGDYADALSNAASIPTTEGANSITVDTTVLPSEFTATWTGWHDSSVKEWDGSDWQ